MGELERHHRDSGRFRSVSPRRVRWTGAVCSALMISSALAACAEGSREGDPEPSIPSAGVEWEPVWADEFEGERLDRDSWNVVVMPDPFNEELQYYTGRADDDPGANVWLEDGVLVIEGRAETYEHRAYTSARLDTAGLREFLYGRFEARIRMPSETGTWPAFWMLGSNIDEVGWPACGEIDIMEGKGRLPTWTSVAIHGAPEPELNRIVSAAYLLPEGDFQSEWHEFAVEWEPEELRWFVDGELIHRLYKPAEDRPGYWPFDDGHPFYLLLNLAIGGWFDEGHPPPENMAPQRLLVDWVRVYRRAADP